MSTLRERILVWRDPLVTNAKQFGIDPSYAAAVAAWESGGNPSAGIDKYQKQPDGTWRSVVSYSQGIGAMQVVPKEAPNPVFRNRPGIDQLLDVNFNIRYAISEILAPGFNHCGNKVGGLVQYFVGSGCVPTGSSDPNGSDYTYVNGILALEGQFLDFNSYAPDQLAGLRELGEAWKRDYEQLAGAAHTVGLNPGNWVMGSLTFFFSANIYNNWKSLLKGE